MRCIRRKLRDLIERSFDAQERLSPLAMGIDVARSGKDETIISRFDGNKQLPFVALRTNDLVEVASAIRDLALDGFDHIAVDDSGVGGGLTDILRSYGIEFHAVNFAQRAKGFLNTDCRRLGNARAEMYFSLLDELKKNQVVLYNDKILVRELTSLRLKPVSGGNMYYLEPKEELKARIGRSPDRSDATVLARYAMKLQPYPSKKILFV